MVFLCVTVDLDRDVNIPVPGHAEAGSIDRGYGTDPRYISTCRGLPPLAELLDSMGVKATFFAEGQTLERLKDQSGCLDGFEIGVHGYCHEDYSLLARVDAEESIIKARCIVKDVSGTYPKSFRAPYMRKPGYLNDLLSETGFSADSSDYSSGTLTPYKACDGIAEVPVFRRVCDGRVSTGYLWPMHEGKRDPGSYTDMVRGVPEDSTVVIADHTWHISESRVSGIFDDADMKKQIGMVEKVLGGFLDLGYEPRTISEVARTLL